MNPKIQDGRPERDCGLDPRAFAPDRSRTPPQPSGMDARTHRALLDLVLEASADCVKVLDGEGRLLFISSGGLCSLEIEDFTPFTGRAWVELWGAERQLAETALADAVRGQVARIRGTMRDSQGHTEMVGCGAQPDPGTGRLA